MGLPRDERNRRDRPDSGTGARGVTERNRRDGPIPGRRSPRCYSGMLPCFFGGSVWRLLRSARSARVTWDRVSAGRMTAST